MANRPDGQGGYVFSGQGSGGAPFVDKPGGVAFQGVGGSVNVATDEPLPLTLDGGNVWLSANTGNGVFVTKNTNSSNAWIDAGRVTSPDQITNSTYDIQFSTAGGATTYSVLKDGNAVSTGNPFVSGQEISVDGMSFAITGAPADGDDFQTTPSTKSLSVFDALDKAVAAAVHAGPGRAESATGRTGQPAQPRPVQQPDLLGAQLRGHDPATPRRRQGTARRDASFPLKLRARVPKTSTW